MDDSSELIDFDGLIDNWLKDYWTRCLLKILDDSWLTGLVDRRTAGVTYIAFETFSKLRVVQSNFTKVKKGWMGEWM